jgi:hypothetical protein
MNYWVTATKRASPKAIGGSRADDKGYVHTKMESHPLKSHGNYC